MNTQETPAPVRDRCAAPVNLDVMEDPEVLAWIGQFAHAGRVIERISERLAGAHKRLALRFPDAAGAQSVARANNILAEASELLVDGSADLALWLSEREAPADEDAADEPSPATASPEPAEPQEATEDDGDPDIRDIFVVRYAGEFVKPDEFYRSEHCDPHGTKAIHVFDSKLDAERVAIDAADGHTDCRFEVLQGRMVIDFDQPLSETRSVCVPAGTDPDAAVMPIAQDETDAAA